MSQLLHALRSTPAHGLDPAGREISLAGAPAVLDLLGGNAAAVGAPACQWPLSQAAAVAVQRRDDRRLRLTLFPKASGIEATLDFSLDDLYGTASLLPVETLRALCSGPRHWASYLLGAYWALARHRKLTRRAPGANILCYIPWSMDPSSSITELLVAAFAALTSAYHLILDPLETVPLAQAALEQLVGQPSLEPLAGMLGHAGRVLIAHSHPSAVVGEAPLPPDLRIYGLRLHTASPEASSIHRFRTAAQMAQAIITRTYKDFGLRSDPTRGLLANLDPEMYRRYFQWLLPATLTGEEFLTTVGPLRDRSVLLDPVVVYPIRDAAAFFLEESQRASALMTRLQTAPADLASWHALGNAMFEAHQAAAHRPALAHPAADRLVHLLRDHGQGIYGARLSGNHFVSLLCDASTPSTALTAILAEFQSTTGVTATLLDGTSAGAAETGTQRFPAQELLTFSASPGGSVSAGGGGTP